MKNKIFCLALSVMLGVSCLTACGQEVVTKEEESSIVFSWWGNDKRHNYTMDAVDVFQQKHSAVNVKYRYGEWSGYERKNRVWMESNSEADVMQINYAWLNEYSADGNGFYDLNELSDYIDLSQYDQSDLEYGMKNEKLNALPIAFNMATFCYNKDLYDKYGLDCPKTWEDIFKVSEVFSEEGIYTLGMPKKHLLLMLIAYYEQTTGEKAFSEDGELLLDVDDIAYLLDFYKELVDKKVLMPVDQFDRGKFSNAEVSASIFWVSDADNYCVALENNGYHPAISDFPMAENAKLTGIYMKPATMYAISNTTEHPEEAAVLLDYLLNDETMVLMQGTEKGVPASKKAIEILKNNNMLEGYGYEAYLKMEEHKDELDIMIPIMESEDVLNVFKENADAYIYQIEDKDETAKKIYEGINTVIKEK